jgi:uncharacterized protein (TIGR03435 family)
MQSHDSPGPVVIVLRKRHNSAVALTLRHSVAAIAILLLPTRARMDGAQVEPGAGTPLTFEVASVKPSLRDRPNTLRYNLGPESVTIPQATLHSLIQQAYDVARYQVTGGPDWGNSEFYDIQAKAGSAVNVHQLRTMLQNLLAERYLLKVHRETRMVTGYALVVDKAGPKLPPANTVVPADSTGVVQMGGGLWARAATMSNVARALSIPFQEPVVDETKIEGHYDFRARFEDSDSMGVAAAADSAFHDFGLRLERKKISLDMVVIDSATRPSGN